MEATKKRRALTPLSVMLTPEQHAAIKAAAEASEGMTARDRTPSAWARRVLLAEAARAGKE